MQLEVLTPDALLYKGIVKHIVLPGLDGSFGVLDNHAPMIAGLKKGSVKVQQDPEANKQDLTGEIFGKLTKENHNKAEFTFDIKGGVVEVKGNKVIVLAE